jgi:hypothetical protein
MHRAILRNNLHKSMTLSSCIYKTADHSARKQMFESFQQKASTVYVLNALKCDLFIFFCAHIPLKQGCPKLILVTVSTKLDTSGQDFINKASVPQL